MNASAAIDYGAGGELLVASVCPPQGPPLQGPAARVAAGAAQCFRTAADAVDYGHDLAGRWQCAKAYRLLGELEGLTRDTALAASRTAEPLTIAAREMPDYAHEVVRYDEYMGVIRCPILTPAEAVAGAAPVLRALAADLAGGTPISPDEVAILTRFAADVLERGAETALRAQDEVLFGAAPAIRPLRRWKAGHQLYALTNRAAAWHVHVATRAWLDGDPTGTAAALSRAEAFVRAITGAMEWAAAMSSSVYQRTVRPTMKLGDLELTGGQNSDHAAFRAAMASFLPACDDEYRPLARKSRAVARARDALLQADLYDLDRHKGLTYRLVGDAAALDEEDQGSAVMALRGLYDRRMSAYAPLMRLGAVARGPRPASQPDRASS